MFGDVLVRLSDRSVEPAKLHAFVPIPLPDDERGGYKVIIYGVIELEVDGSFMARQLSEIHRKKE